MEESKTVAERLREYGTGKLECFYAELTGRSHLCNNYNLCRDCERDALRALANQIEAEQAELRKQLDFERDAAMRERDCLSKRIEELEAQSVDVDALLKLAGEMEDYFAVPPYKILRADSSTVSEWESRIRRALKGANPSKSMPLPEGVEWPRFEDGDLVKFGDQVGKGDMWMESPVDTFFFFSDGDVEIRGNGNSIVYGNGEPVKRPEPEVLDADGVPIKVGDTVWKAEGFAECFVVSGFGSEAGMPTVKTDSGRETYAHTLTHRKPDTQEDIESDSYLEAAVYCRNHGLVYEGHFSGDTATNEGTAWGAMVRDLLARQRKLMGGE